MILCGGIITAGRLRLRPKSSGISVRRPCRQYRANGKGVLRGNLDGYCRFTNSFSMSVRTVRRFFALSILCSRSFFCAGCSHLSGVEGGSAVPVLERVLSDGGLPIPGDFFENPRANAQFSHSTPGAPHRGFPCSPGRPTIRAKTLKATSNVPDFAVCFLAKRAAPRLRNAAPVFVSKTDGAQARRRVQLVTLPPLPHPGAAAACAAVNAKDSPHNIYNELKACKAMTYADEAPFPRLRSSLKEIPNLRDGLFPAYRPSRHPRSLAWASGSF